MTPSTARRCKESPTTDPPRPAPVVAQAEAVIERHPSEVFEFIGPHFAANYPRWSREVQELEIITPGPLRVGTLVRQVRLDHGFRSESEFRVTVYRPAQRIGFEGSCSPFWCDYGLIATERPSATLTRFSFGFTQLPLPFRPFLELIRRVTQHDVERTINDLKRLLEEATY